MKLQDILDLNYPALNINAADLSIEQQNNLKKLLSEVSRKVFEDRKELEDGE